MRPIDGDGGGALLHGRGPEGRACGLRAPGLDVAAQWREIFAVETGGEGGSPRRAGTPGAAPAAPRHADAADEMTGGGVPHGAARAGPLRRTEAETAPVLPDRAAARQGIPQLSTAASPAPRITSASRLPGAASADLSNLAVGQVPHSPVASVQSAAPIEAGGPSALRDPVSAGRAAKPRACDEPAGPALLDLARAPPASGAREFVHVRCRDGAVFVIVRDAGLSPAAAIRCSLETAYALRGERAALRRVSLNGRTVFERPEAAPSTAAGPPGRLCFAC